MEAIAAWMPEFWRLLGIYWGYIILFALTLIVIRFTTRVPDYIFRKLLHIVAFTSIFPLLLCTADWRAAVLVEISFLMVIIVALHFFERFSFYHSLFVEKGKHEVITSFVMLFSLMTILLAVFWGMLGEGFRYIPGAAIMAWGPGDAAAAIVGRNWGKHKLSGPHIEGVKSLEGTIAMGVTSFVCTFGTLVWMSELSLGSMVLISLIIAPIAALVELYTKHGLDTVTVPIAASVILGAFALL